MNVYFLIDNTIDRPTSLEEWREGIKSMKQALGLEGKSFPYASELFLDPAEL